MNCGRQYLLYCLQKRSLSTQITERGLSQIQQNSTFFFENAFSKHILTEVYNNIEMIKFKFPPLPFKEDPSRFDQFIRRYLFFQFTVYKTSNSIYELWQVVLALLPSKKAFVHPNNRKGGSLIFVQSSTFSFESAFSKPKDGCIVF